MNKEMYTSGRKYFKKHSNNNNFTGRVSSLCNETGCPNTIVRYADFLDILIDFVDGVPIGIFDLSGSSQGDRFSSFLSGMLDEQDGISHN